MNKDEIKEQLVAEGVDMYKLGGDDTLDSLIETFEEMGIMLGDTEIRMALAIQFLKDAKEIRNGSN